MSTYRFQPGQDPSWGLLYMIVKSSPVCIVSTQVCCIHVSMYPCIHGMVDVCLVCGEIKTQLPCPANTSDLWWCMRTDTANISYRNLICNEGRRGQILSLYHSTTGTTLTFVPFCHTLSYLNRKVFYIFFFLIHPDALTIFQGWLPNNYHCLICRPCLHELCLEITEKISDCLLCTLTNDASINMEKICS